MLHAVSRLLSGDGRRHSRLPLHWGSFTSMPSPRLVARGAAAEKPSGHRLPCAALSAEYRRSQ